MNYFEFNERRTQGSVAVDVIDWPDITVSESEPTEDQLLELSLLRKAPESK